MTEYGLKNCKLACALSDKITNIQANKQGRSTKISWNSHQSFKNFVARNWKLITNSFMIGRYKCTTIYLPLYLIFMNENRGRYATVSPSLLRVITLLLPLKLTTKQLALHS